MSLRSVLLAPLFFVVACGGAASVPAPATIAASEPQGEAAPRGTHWTTPGENVDYFVGRWEGTDDIGWVYSLSVQPSGAYTLDIDQNTQGTQCTVNGDLHPEDGEIVLAMQLNGCNSDFTGVTERHPLVELQNDSFGVEYGSYVVAYQRQ